MVSRKAKLRTEAPVNGGRNYNGPKVAPRCLSKIWPNAGTSEYLRLLSIDSDDARSADNQQERPDRTKERFGILRDLTPDCLICRGQTEDKVRTAWRHAEVGRNDRPLEARESRESNKIKRNSLSGKFRPARMA